MINFILKEKKEGKKSAVSCIISGVYRITKKNERIKFALGISVEPQIIGTSSNNFAYDHQHLMSQRSYEGNLLRNKIHQITDKYYLLNNNYALEGITPTKEEYEDKLLGILNDEGIIESKKILKQKVHYFDDFIRYHLATVQKNIDNGVPTIKPNSLRFYTSIFNHLLNYQEYTKKRIVIEELKVSTLLEIVEVANKQATGEIIIKNNHVVPNGTNKTNKTRNKAGYSTYYRNIMLGIFKSFIRKIDTDEIEVRINLSDSRLSKQPAKCAKKLYFDLELLNQIYKYSPIKDRTRRAREYVILASCLGMRYQSVKLLEGQKPQEHICENGDKFYTVVNQADKTGVTILSPLFRPVMEIYEQNNNSFPKVFQKYYVSKCIRELLVEMGVSKEFEYHEYVHNKGIISTKKDITEIASSHDCRKTFITNLKRLKIDSYVIKNMTHRKIDDDSSSFNIYDSSSAIDRAEIFYEATKKLNSSIYYY